MNNQRGKKGRGGWVRGVRGGSTERSLVKKRKKRVKKKVKKKQPLLCWVFEVLPPADTGVQMHPKAHRLSLAILLCFLAASLVFSPFHLLRIPSSSPSVCSRDPLCPPVLIPLVFCPGFDICSQKDQQHTSGPFLLLPPLL